MKKLLLSFVAIAMVTIGMGQVVSFIVLDGPNAGAYSMTYADGADWGSPDMTDPNNAITGTMCLVDDGDADPDAAKEGCNPLVNSVGNGNDLTGKIAVVWRGNCEFGAKALNAQNAGAIGVVIVNHLGAEPVGMGGGADGLSVTIPVFMISTNTGDNLLTEFQNCATNCFMGNKFGYFADDVGLAQKDVLRARQFATPSALAQNGSEFSVTPGAKVFNFGSNDQTNVVVTCEITGPGVTGSYLETSTPINLLSGDSSAVMTFTPFSQANYPEEYYTMTYTVTSDAAADEYPADNLLNADFMITDREYAISRVDPVTMEPDANNHYQPGTFTTSFNSCVHFTDPNASRTIASGVTFNATSRTGTTLTGEIVNVEAYTWEDLITDINDPNFGITIVNNLTYGEHEYLTDDQNIAITTNFEEPVSLEDNVNYFFCITSTSQDVFLGYDAGLDYDENITLDGHIVSVLGNDVSANGNWFGLGFGSDLATAIVVNIDDPSWLGLEENEETVELSAYPNPAVNEVIIPLNGIEGAAALNIVDVAGKIISTQNVNISDSQITLDVSDIASGMYVFNLSFENGKTSTFNVVVEK